MEKKREELQEKMSTDINFRVSSWVGGISKTVLDDKLLGLISLQVLARADNIGNHLLGASRGTLVETIRVRWKWPLIAAAGT